jgi:two-component system, OmpR family, response regulator
MSHRRSSRILVVDNYDDVADSLALLVRLWGYDAEVCYDGPPVLEAALAYLPQIVLLDIGLPGMDGFQVARCLRNRLEFVNLVIIGISGYGHESHRLRALADGFDHYLLKPVELDELQGLLSQAPGRAELVPLRGAKQLMGAIS